jgi:hypothetical protein
MDRVKEKKKATGEGCFFAFNKQTEKKQTKLSSATTE